MTPMDADKGNAMEVVPLIGPKCGADLDVPDVVGLFRQAEVNARQQSRYKWALRLHELEVEHRSAKLRKAI